MRFLAVLAVLAILAMPAASASPIDATLAEAERQVDAAQRLAAEAYAAVLAPFADAPLAPEERAPPPAPPAREPDEAPPQAAPAPAREPDHEQDAIGALVAPASRLVPIPITDAVGALPRIDLAQIARNVDDVQPLAPAPAAAPAAPAAAPVRAQSAQPAPASIVPAEVVLAGVVATAGAAAAAQGAPAALWERLRRLGFLALLYSRISKERLLDHGTRERLLGAIRAKPGLAVADLAGATGIPRNTVSYHLRVLEREGLASSTRNGRNRLFFAPGSLQKRDQADALATLRHETTLAVARRIGERPGVDQKALCEALGLSPSLAHWHADRLVASGLVDKRREGRFVRYYPGAAFGIVDGRAA